ERLRSLKVDYKLKFGWLLDWKIGWLRTLENFVHITGCSTKQVRQTGTVRSKPARRRKFGFRGYGGQLALQRQLSHPSTPAKQHTVGKSDKAVGAPIRHCGEGARYITGGSHFKPAPIHPQ